MPKVGVELGVTLHLGDPQNNEYIRIKMNVDEIDTTMDVKKQLDAAYKAMNQTVQMVEKALEDKVNESLGVSLGAGT